MLFTDDESEGVMDSLLMAVKTGSAFGIGGDRREGRRRSSRSSDGEKKFSCLEIFLSLFCARTPALSPLC